ncbi:MAG TPA: nucleoside phosphorylase [Candidatus Tidjanibacter faecipullorum]|uniref:Uridine phosphorylase n=1 Tax=Candidatus Tidjanibacter faecipullorum TaxID=2838766 RepID=A0A9D2DD68_9BACT|nr:nucleoside phosphorylase [Candidatus Tidjanibacter faecipullorum]
MKRTIPASELILNDDGSVFHLHLRPEQLADTVLLVGDPGRVETVAARFDTREEEVSNREFHTVTGTFRGKRLSVVSTGIGTDNIDIVLTELDALANIDLTSRTVRPQFRQLTLLRLGTCGALQSDLAIGSLIFSHTSIGMDGLLNFYAGRERVCNLAMEQAMLEQVKPDPRLATPYCIDADGSLAELFRHDTVPGITISAPGFYAPQGRYLRLAPADPGLLERLAAFSFDGLHVTNCEMESSAVAGLAALMGHRAATICTVIAQRVAHDSDTDYQALIGHMIDTALARLTE